MVRKPFTTPLCVCEYGGCRVWASRLSMCCCLIFGFLFQNREACMWLGRQPRKPVEDVRLGRIVIRLHFSDSIGFELAPNL